MADAGKPKRRQRRPAAKQSGPAPLSWNLVVAILSGRLRAPLPEDAYGPGFDTTAATTAVPGSDEKIEVMRQRAKRFEKLFHPKDGSEERNLR